MLTGQISPLPWHQSHWVPSSLTLLVSAGCSGECLPFCLVFSVAIETHTACCLLYLSFPEELWILIQSSFGPWWLPPVQLPRSSFFSNLCSSWFCWFLLTESPHLASSLNGLVHLPSQSEQAPWGTWSRASGACPISCFPS